jgi:hypothetical protein
MNQHTSNSYSTFVSELSRTRNLCSGSERRFAWHSIESRIIAIVGSRNITWERSRSSSSDQVFTLAVLIAKRTTRSERVFGLCLARSTVELAAARILAAQLPYAAYASLPPYATDSFGSQRSHCRTHSSMSCASLNCRGHQNFDNFDIHGSFVTFATIQVILAGFAEQNRCSALHMSSLFHAFILCQLWTMYCENISAQNPPGSEQYQQCTLTLSDFWAKITPGILQLVCHVKDVRIAIILNLTNA